ncbi:MAG: RNA-binding protein [Chitinivibrionales bacterium]|nr:RNA-binding protein [Chitinivibrionales bacterium]MBD3396750.1 RNA-binding protein [Chitinivibrionales bacterium]
MAEKVFVKNLPHDTTEEVLKEHFSTAGQVLSVKIIRDQRGRSRCFGFVEVEEPDAVIEALDGKELGKRPLKVARARPQVMPGGGPGGRGRRGGPRDRR